MKEIVHACHFTLCSWEEMSEADRELLTAAKEATLRSYAPYSRFNVGAAVRLDDGTVVTGNNQENAAYPSGLCAERTTLFYVGSRYPDHAVETIAIAARTDKGFTEEPVPPCGACRQVMLETETRHGRPMRILLYGQQGTYVIEGVNQILPLIFDGSSLPDASAVMADNN